MSTVSEWLNQMGLGHLAEIFKKNDIDFEILRTLTDADLKELGIDSFGARRKIMSGLATPSSSNPPSPSRSVGGADAVASGATMFVAPTGATLPVATAQQGTTPGEVAIGKTVFAPASPQPPLPLASGVPPLAARPHGAPGTVEAGAILGDRYQLLTELGRGAMGVVFQAWDTKLKQACAIKVMLPGVVADATARELFVKEAQRAVRLAHPNLLRVNSLEDNPCDYLVMEYVDGGNLTDRWHQNRGRLDAQDVRQLLAQVLRGLAYLHGEGLVHRDIKPDNVLLTKDGKVKLADYGVSTSLREQRQNAQVAGTLLYMAPEQLRGDPALDGRADLYAVGMIAHQLLLGRFPFDGGNAAAIRDWHLSSKRELDDLNAVQGGTIFTKALSLPPEERWATADEMASALEATAAKASKSRSRFTVGVGGDVATIVEGLAKVPANGTLELLPGEHECSTLISQTVTIEATAADKPVVFSTSGPVFTITGGMPVLRNIVIEQRENPEDTKRKKSNSATSDRGRAEQDERDELAELLDDPDEQDKLEAEALCRDVHEEFERDWKRRDGATARSAIVIAEGSPLISDSVIRAISGIGIAVINSDANPAITNCVISGCEFDGIRFGENTRGEVRGTSVTENECGIHLLLGSNPNIAECKISNNRLSGLKSDKDSFGTVDGCVFNRNGTGLSISGKTRFLSCEITGSHMANALAYRESYFFRCKFKGSAHDRGIQIFGNSHLEECESSENMSDALWIASGNPTIRSSKFYNSIQGHGIRVSREVKGIIENCECYNNAGAGISVEGDESDVWKGVFGDRPLEKAGTPTVRNSKFFGSVQQVGMSIGGHGKYESCESFGNADGGVVITGGGNPFFRNSKFHGNLNGYGILVTDDGLGTFESCESFRNQKDGIAVGVGGNPTVRDSKFYESVQGSGILVGEGGLGTFERCECSRNDQAGISVRARGNPTVRASTFHESVNSCGILVDDDGQGIFENCRSERNKFADRRRGADLEYRLELTFEEAALGTPKDVSFARQEECGTCHGTGRTLASQCTGCRGQGQTEQLFSMTAKVPQGVNDGTKLRFRGVGDAGRGGGPSGNLLILVSVKEHPRFTRDGNDVHCEITLSSRQAAQGCAIEVPTVDGKAMMNVPAGTESGSVLRLHNNGIPHLGGDGRGDQLVKIRVEPEPEVPPKSVKSENPEKPEKKRGWFW
jgi:serine/threonine protein kinase/DnaJ-class molecular chaperone